MSKCCKKYNKQFSGAFKSKTNRVDESRIEINEILVKDNSVNNSIVTFFSNFPNVDTVKDNDLERVCKLYNFITKNIEQTTQYKNNVVTDNAKTELINIKTKLCELFDEINIIPAEQPPSDDSPQQGIERVIECGNKYFKFKTRGGDETCLGNWQAVLDLVQGNPECYDSIEKTVNVPTTPSRRTHYTKRTFYRVIKKCVNNPNMDYKLKYVTPRDEDRKQTQTTPPTRIQPSGTPRQRLSGQQSTGSTVKTPSPTTRSQGLEKVLDDPKLTDDEQYILDLFKD